MFQHSAVSECASDHRQTSVSLRQQDLQEQISNRHRPRELFLATKPACLQAIQHKSLPMGESVHAGGNSLCDCSNLIEAKPVSRCEA